jgi:peptidoglycan/LPS O-acetylase OafA/YrhL
MARLSHWIDIATQRLSRVTSSGRYIPELDGLRFIAITSVFLQHVQQMVAFRLGMPPDAPLDISARLIRDYRIGVELFFVISGFILGLPFADQYLRAGRPVRLRAYYWRRLTRLEPPYIFSLLLCTAILLVQEGKTWTEIGPHLLASTFYVHNIVYGHFSTINTVAWSLEVEVQFYCLAPLFALLFRLRNRRNRRAAIVGVAMLSFSGQHCMAYFLPGFPTTLLMHLQYFMMGFLIADIYLTDWQDSPKRSPLWDLVAIPGWVLLPFVFYVPLPATGLLMACLLCVVFAASLRSQACSAVLRSAPIRTLGGMCYTIYLLHHPIIWRMAPFVYPSRGGALIVKTMGYAGVVALVVVPVSTVYFLLVERPCMRKTWPADLYNAVMSQYRRLYSA